MLLDRYYAANKIYWNERVDVNLRSWDVDGFLAEGARKAMRNNVEAGCNNVEVVIKEALAKAHGLNARRVQ